MEKLSVQWNGKKYDCEKYDKSDLPKILEVFFFGKRLRFWQRQQKAKIRLCRKNFQNGFAVWFAA